MKVLAFALALGAAAPASADQAAVCAGVVECRAHTETAIAQGDHERAHDLAWRTVQQGPRNDRALMFLLGRTQALSNRPDDALVMVRRLADMGAIVDVSADEFARMRDLPGWPAVESLLAGVATPPPAAVAAPVAPKRVAEAAVPKVPAPKASASARSESGELRRDKPVAPPPPMLPVAVEDAGHFTSGDFSPGGLTCDAVSKRFVFGDRPGRKLMVVAEGSDHSIDLTRADVAGFLDVTALDIDTTNGNLWVASAEAGGRGATLHRVQLISGRPIASFNLPETLAPAIPVDVAMSSGGVLMLDALQHRVLILRTGASSLSVLADLGDAAPLSLTASRQDGVAYVTHRDGLLAVDLKTRAVGSVTGPKTEPLSGIERLRRYGGGLVGLQTLPDGSRRLVRLTLDASGRTVTRLRVLDVPIPSGPAAIPLAVCGNTLGYLLGAPATSTQLPGTAWTIRRIQLNP